MCHAQAALLVGQRHRFFAAVCRSKTYHAGFRTAHTRRSDRHCVAAVAAPAVRLQTTDAADFTESWRRLQHGMVQGRALEEEASPKPDGNRDSADDATLGSTLHSALSLPTLIDSQLMAPYPNARWDVRLAIKLIQELRKGAESPLAETIKVLPKPHLCPAVFDTETLRQLQYSPAFEAVDEYQHLLEEAWEALRFAGVVERLYLSNSEFEWAMMMVRSPCMHQPLLGRSGFIEQGDVDSCSCLDADREVPCSGHHGDMSLELEVNEQAMWVAGEQSNDDFFMQHGSVVLGNPADTFVLFRNLRHVVIWYLDAVAGLLPERSIVRVLHTSVARAAAATVLEAELQACQHSQQCGTMDGTIPVILIADQGPCFTPHSVGFGTYGRGFPPPNPNTAPINMSSVTRASGGFRCHNECSTDGKCACLPELIVRADGMVDVRLVAALQHLAVQCAAVTAAAATAACTGGGGDGGRHPGGPAPGGHGGGGHGSGGSLSAHAVGRTVKVRRAAASAAPPWYNAVSQRCSELLGGFPTSVEEDFELLEQLERRRATGEDCGPGLQKAEQLALVVQYRMAKKQVLRQMLCHVALLDAQY